MADRTWELTADPALALVHLSPSLTERSSRRAAVGIFRTAEHLLRTIRARAFLQTLDEYADGTLTRNQLELDQYVIGPTPAEPRHDDGPVGPRLWLCGFPVQSRRRDDNPSLVDLRTVSREVGLAAASDRAGHHPPDVHPASPWHATFQETWYAARAAHADVIRCALPTPLRDVPFEAVWRTSTVLAIAAQARETDDFGGMPILADALQDAGCYDEELLAHLRNRQGHHGCCWGVRVVLGRPRD
jgi:hypothetical protein